MNSKCPRYLYSYTHIDSYTFGKEIYEHAISSGFAKGFKKLLNMQEDDLTNYVLKHITEFSPAVQLKVARAKKWQENRKSLTFGTLRAIKFYYTLTHRYYWRSCKVNTEYWEAWCKYLMTPEDFTTIVERMHSKYSSNYCKTVKENVRSIHLAHFIKTTLSYKSDKQIEKNCLNFSWLFGSSIKGRTYEDNEVLLAIMPSVAKFLSTMEEYTWKVPYYDFEHILSADVSVYLKQKSTFKDYLDVEKISNNFVATHIGYTDLAERTYAYHNKVEIPSAVSERLCQINDKAFIQLPQLLASTKDIINDMIVNGSSYYKGNMTHYKRMKTMQGR